MYLTTFHGAIAVGSLAWGRLADVTSVPTALLAAAGLGGLALGLLFLKPLPEAEPELTPSMHWPEPTVASDMAASLAEGRGPVLVTVTYEVARPDVPMFLHALQALAQEKLLDGAAQWGVYEVVGQPRHLYSSLA